jgi:hypothetical protein
MCVVCGVVRSVFSFKHFVFRAAKANAYQLPAALPWHALRLRKTKGLTFLEDLYSCCVSYFFGAYGLRGITPALIRLPDLT